MMPLIQSPQINCHRLPERPGAALTGLLCLLCVWFGLQSSPAATNTFFFTYTNRAALLADGWSFVATLPGGAQRDTENTNPAAGPVVSYDQSAHPGVLRIPVADGGLWGASNTTTNSLFRNLSSNWVSLRLEATFSPARSYVGMQLVLYQDDDNYLEVAHNYNSYLGGELCTADREDGGAQITYSPVSFGAIRVASSNVRLRWDRNLTNDNVTAMYSLDGTNWVAVGTSSQALPYSRLGITTTGGTYETPNCDLRRLDIITSDTPLQPLLVAQPQHLVFNAMAGQPCTNLQQLRVVARRAQAPLAWTNACSAPWFSTSTGAGVTPGACDVSVNTAGLAPGVYQGSVQVGAPGLDPVTTLVTLIVNPAARARVSTWQGGAAGAMSVTVDDSYLTAFDALYTNGFRGTYYLWTRGPVGTDYTSLGNYYTAGMELGMHSYDHPCWEVSEPSLRFEFETNMALITASTPAPAAGLISMAWPCGTNTIAERVIAADYFLSSRWGGVNQLEDPSPYDLMNLKGYATRSYVYSTPDLKTVVDGALTQGKWFILILHQYLDEDGAIVYSVGKDLWHDTVGAVSKYIVQRDRTIITNYLESAGQISFNYYRLPIDPSNLRSFETAIGSQDTLTFQVDLTGVATVQGAAVNGSPVAYTNKVIGGRPQLLLNLPVTTSAQTVVLQMGTNRPPVLGAPGNQAVNELATLVVTNTATDPDLPVQRLSYGLVNPPGGAVIDTNGVMVWTPGEGQGPGTYTLTSVVTDNGMPPLSATNSFMVTVNEVNVPPVLPAQADRSIVAQQTLTVTNTATDADLPANALTYQFSGPAGASMSTNGIITWTPTSAQAPSTNQFVTVVTDFNPAAVNAQHLSATNSFTVFVNQINVSPVLPSQTNRVVSELTTLTVTNRATDANLPAQVLTYALVNPPGGAQIDTNGVITWTPNEAQGPGTNEITTVVTDNGEPPLSATNSFMVTVNEVNTAPVLPAQTNYTFYGPVLLAITNPATDADIPANTLAYLLLAAPVGAAINTNGVITWTPTLQQVPSTNVFTTVVTDSNPWAVNAQHLSATNTFTVFVQLPPPTPGLLTVSDRTSAGFTLSWTGAGVLQSASALTNSWRDIGGSSPFYVPTEYGSGQFFRLRGMEPSPAGLAPSPDE